MRVIWGPKERPTSDQSSDSEEEKSYLLKYVWLGQGERSTKVLEAIRTLKSATLFEYMLQIF